MHTKTPSPLCGRQTGNAMSYTNLLYHVVFGTKGRLPMIRADIRPRFHTYLGGTIRGLGGTALEIGGIEDHVHLLIKLKPSMCVADLIRDLKSNSSRWAKENGIVKFGWQRRYGAFTVSESQVKTVRNYIRDQEKHHKKFDYKSEFETMLRSNGITLDGYVWQE